MTSAVVPESRKGRPPETTVGGEANKFLGPAVERLVDIGSVRDFVVAIKGFATAATTGSGPLHLSVS